MMNLCCVVLVLVLVLVLLLDEMRNNCTRIGHDNNLNIQNENEFESSNFTHSTDEYAHNPVYNYESTSTQVSDDGNPNGILRLRNDDSLNDSNHSNQIGNSDNNMNGNIKTNINSITHESNNQNTNVCFVYCVSFFLTSVHCRRFGAL